MGEEDRERITMNKLLAISVALLSLNLYGADKPDLFKVKTFKVKFDHAIIIDGQGGKLKIEEKKGKTGLNDELVWTILDQKTALFIGNLDNQKVPYIKGGSAISFIEPVGGGYMQQLTVFNDWDEKREGFRCVYRRTFTSFGPNPIISSYFGIAKPHN